MIEEKPTVKKVGGPEKGIFIGGLLNNGRLVGIGEYGICLFNEHPESGRRFEEINTRYWGGTTTYPVGLFLTLSDAELCLRNGNLTALDERYWDDTILVLKGIGPNHKVFEIGESLRKHFSLESSGVQA